MRRDNKKGTISGEVLTFFPKMIFLIAVLFAVVLLVKSFIVTTVDVGQVEATILVNRIIYSKGGLSYYDETLQRLYPGTIDLPNFERLSKTNPNDLDDLIINYGETNSMMAARITLKQTGKENINLFYNKDKFDKWEPRTLSTVQGGAGSVKSFKVQEYVLVKEGENLLPATLDFFIIS